MSTPGTFSEALSEIDRLQKVVKVLRESLGEPGAASTVSLADRLVDHEESARVLRELIDGTDPSKGEEFFSSLVRHLATALRMKYAVIWTFLDEARDRMQSLAVWAGDKPGENFTASIPGTPCEQTVQHRAYCEFAGGVQQQFPRAEILATLKIESYFAAPLFGTDGQVMGSLVVMDDRPGRLSPSQRTLLELFAARAGAELGRQKAELALKRSEAHFRALIEQASDVVTVLATDGTVRYQSPSLERVMGWRPEERQGKSAFEQMHPDDVSRAQATIREALAHPGEVRSGEFRLRHREGAYRTLEIVGRVVMDLTGAPCIILNMRDVTERRQAERDRQQALQDLQNILETVPDFLFTIDTDGRLVRWNSRVAQTTGYDSEELLNKPALDFVPGEEREQTAAAIRRAFAEGYAELEGHLMTKDGRLIPYHWIGAALKNAQGDLIGITGVGRDVTERKRSEAEFRRHRRHLLDAQALAHLGSWEWDIDSGTVTWSEEQFRIFGHIPGALVVTDDTFLAALHPDDHDRVLKAINDALLSKAPYDVICRIVRPSGDIRFVHCRGEVDRDEAGRPIRMAGTVLDVTERVHIEEALRAGEERWQLAVRGSNDGIWDWNIKTGDIFLSSRWKAIRGFADEELGHHVDEWRSRIHPDDLDRVLQRLDAYLFRQAPEYREEYRVLCKDGSYRWVLDRGMAVWDENGTPLRMAGSESDITERKQAEMALRMSEERLRLAMDIAKLATWDWNIRTNQVIWSDNCEAVKQLPPGTFKGTFEAYQQLLHPDDLPRLQSDIERALAGRDAYHTEHRLVTSDGGIQWIEGNGYVYRDESNQPIRMIGTARNITERKNTEEALRTSEERLRQALHASNTGLWDWNTETGEVRFSKEWKGQLGYGETELADSFETWESRLHPDDREQAVAYAQAYRLNPVGAFRQDFRLRHKDGSYRWIDSHASFVTEPDGRRVRLLGSHTDITDRKKGEEQLRLTQFTMDRLSEAIFWVGPDARMTYVNDAASRMLGYTKEELLSMSVPEIDPNFPADAWASHWDDLKRRGGFTFESNHRRKDGTVFRTEVTVNYLRFGGKEVNCAIMRDISERKRAEEALRISEERYARATAVGRVGVWELDVRKGEYYGDNNLKALFGYAPNELSTDPYAWLNLVHPEDQTIALNAWERIVAGETDDYAYHIRMRQKGGNLLWTEVRGRAVRDEHGRVTRLIGATVDVTERHVAELELQRTKDHLEAVIKSSPLSIVTFDPEGLVTSWNPASERIFGWTESEAVGREVPWIRQGEEEACEAYWRQIVQAGGANGKEVTRCRKDGSRFEMKIWAAPVRDGHGTIVQWVGFLDDVTELKQAHRDLQRSERELRTVLDALPIGVWFTDSTGKPVLSNPASQRIWSNVKEVEFESGSSKRIWKEVARSVNEPHRWTLSHVLTKGEPSINEVFELKCGGGVKRTILNSAVPVRADDGTVLGAVVLNEDITDRVRAEEELRQHHKLLSAIMDASIDIVYVKDSEGRYVHMNRAGAKILGMSIEDIIGWGDVALWGGDLAAACRASDKGVLESGGTVTVEEVNTVQGAVSHYLTTKAPYRDPEGRIIGIIGISRDITQQKLAEIERERRYSELHAIFGMTVALSRASTLEEIYQKALDGVEEALRCRRASILLFDQQGAMRFVADRGLSDEYRRAVDGHSPWSPKTREPQPILVRDTTTDPAVESHRTAILAEGIRAMAFVPLMSPDGLLGKFMLYYHEPHEFTEDEIGVVQTIAGHVAYSIQRTKDQQALRASEERFAKAFRASLHPVVIGELETGRVIEANDATYQLFGYTREDAVGRTTLEIGLWPSAEDRARFVQLLKRQGSVRNLEANLRTKSGAVRQCLLSSELIELDGKQCMVTVGNDITDRKRAEEELRRSHAFLRQVIDIDPNFIFAKDREGRFTLVNKAVADVYGTTVENLNGKTDADFNPDLEQVEFLRRMDTEVMDSLKERFIPEEVITDAGGRKRWLQTVKRPILDEHGRATMVLGAATDITERKRMEEVLRQREQDLCAAIQEREQISQDLHDGILQSLYAIGLSLETCRPELKKFRAKRITRTLDSVVSQLNAVMGEVRAFIAGLETELWKKQDLSSAIRTMVQTMTLPHAARYRVAIDPSVNEALSPEQGMHLFSIVKEAMSNCLRHAKATRASVSLRRSGEGFKLTVTDNGVGFVPAEVAQTGRGLANMASRATRLGGLFSIQSKPKQGTRINLTIPKETVHA